jgi:hypothetical protein
MMIATEVKNLQRHENDEWDIEQAQGLKLAHNNLIWHNAPANTTLGGADEMACFFYECISLGKLKSNEAGNQ